jgi:hypothetical protein
VLVCRESQKNFQKNLEPHRLDWLGELVEDGYPTGSASAFGVATPASIVSTASVNFARQAVNVALRPPELIEVLPRSGMVASVDGGAKEPSCIRSSRPEDDDLALASRQRFYLGCSMTDMREQAS